MSSEDEYFDSDNVDSDIEAELYSAIHHGSGVATLKKTSLLVKDSDIVITPSKNINKTTIIEVTKSDNSLSKDLFIIDVDPTARKIPISNNISSKCDSDLLLTKGVSTMESNHCIVSNPIKVSCKPNLSKTTNSYSLQPNQVKKPSHLNNSSNVFELSDTSACSSDEDLCFIKMRKTKNVNDCTSSNTLNFSYDSEDSNSFTISSDTASSGEESTRKKAKKSNFSFFKNSKSAKKLFKDFSKIPDDSDCSASSLDPLHNLMNKAKSNSSSDIEILSDSDSSAIVTSPVVINSKSAKKLKNLSKVPDDSNSSASSLDPLHNLMNKVESNSLNNKKTESILSDSDSSVIVTSPEVVEKNVDTVLLRSSDSDSELSDTEPSNLNISLNVSNPQELVQWSTGDYNEEFWKISYEDAFPYRNQGRYHSGMDLVCKSCGRKGHTANFCNNKNSLLGRDVKCYICGGSHFANYCKDKICFNCFEPGHDSCFLKSSTMCDKCFMLGHDNFDCPDIWRRYHLTTENKRFIESDGNCNQQNSPLYCCNCGAEGHYNAQCAFPVMNRRYFPTNPVVLQKQTKKQNYPWKIAALHKKLKKRKLKESSKKKSKQQKSNTHPTVNGHFDSGSQSSPNHSDKYKNGSEKRRSSKQSEKNNSPTQECKQLKKGKVVKQRKSGSVGPAEGKISPYKLEH